MKTKHTPGPWRTTGSLISNESRVLIASLSGASDDDVEAANASLIAAAPELLYELETLVQYAQGGDAPPKSVVNRARAAIAKATSRE